MLAISHMDIMYPLYDVMRRAIPLCGGLSQNPDPNKCEENIRATQIERHSTKYLTSTLQNCQGHEVPSQNSNAGDVRLSAMWDPA